MPVWPGDIDRLCLFYPGFSLELVRERALHDSDPVYCPRTAFHCLSFPQSLFEAASVAPEEAVKEAEVEFEEAAAVPGPVGQERGARCSVVCGAVSRISLTRMRGNRLPCTSGAMVYAFFFLLSLDTMACTIPSQTSSTALRTRLITLTTVTQAIMGTIFNLTTSYMINLDESHLNGKVRFGFG
ncbi:hypothetical protein G3M48_007224 [Beauveria asiatica]|uniref:Uncharacterized protein n=1 Tax=Beauveria asiatica TaxID=1069075 RepID=A0AAW0S4U5_9HYPO